MKRATNIHTLNVTFSSAVHGVRVILAALLIAAASSGSAQAGTAPCTDFAILSAANAGSAPHDPATGKVTLGGSKLVGIDPDEIDVACAPTVVIEGLTLKGVTPAQIDFGSTGEVTVPLLDGETNLPGHILLARQVSATGATAEVQVTGSLVLQPARAVLREQVVSKRPYASVVVMDLEFDVIDLVPDSKERLEVFGFRLASGSTVPENTMVGTTLMDAFQAPEGAQEGGYCVGSYCACVGEAACNEAIAACFAMPHVDPDGAWICDSYNDEGQCTEGTCYMY